VAATAPKRQIFSEYVHQADLLFAASPWKEEVAAFFNEGKVGRRRRYLTARLRLKRSLLR
jgi:hypothetical protein